MKDQIFELLDDELSGLISTSMIERMADKVNTLVQDKLDEESSIRDDMEWVIKEACTLNGILRAPESARLSNKAAWSHRFGVWMNRLKELTVALGLKDDEAKEIRSS
jgi:hypothetical protein